MAEASQLAGYDLEPRQLAHDDTVQQQARAVRLPRVENFFYYGFDTNTPSSDINLLTVTLHEFAHGLGFVSLADESTGTFCCGEPAAARHLRRLHLRHDGEEELERHGDGRRAAGFGDQHGEPRLDRPVRERGGGGIPVEGSGPHGLLAGRGRGIVYGGDGGLRRGAHARRASPGRWSRRWTRPIRRGPSTTDACSALTNAAAVAGKIALVDRGTCDFTQKAVNVQAAGAIGMVVANNVEGGRRRGWAGRPPRSPFPSSRVSQADGVTLRANLPAQATIGLDPSHPAGMNASRADAPLRAESGGAGLVRLALGHVVRPETS